MDTDTKTAVAIVGFAVVTRQDAAIDGSRHDGLLKEYEPTRAGLAEALDDAAYYRVENRGMYGNIGCGGTWVVACYEMDGEDLDAESGVEVEYLWDTICSELPCGRPSTRTLGWLRHRGGSVWDGNNHVAVDPRNYEQVLREHLRHECSCYS